MKHIKLFENFSNDDSMDILLDIKKSLENRIDDYFDGQIYHGDQGYQDLLNDLSDIEERIEELERKKTIEDYPQSVKHIYKRFNSQARKSIDDNVEKFVKIAKKVFYNDKKSWKDYFKDKEVRNLNNLTQVMDSLEKWLK